MPLRQIIIQKYGEIRGGVWKWRVGTPKHVKEIWKGLLNERQRKLL